MKRVFNKFVLASLVTLTAFQAQAGATYICLGLDEATGFATVNAGREQAGNVFGHAQGYELRLLDDGGMLSLTLKKSDSDVIAVVSYNSRGILFRQGNVNVSCVLQQ